MKIHEYQAATIFEEAGLPVVPGRLAHQAEEALAIAEELGYPVVLKSQVLVGGRGKAGGIKVVGDSEELKETFAKLKTLVIKDYAVEKVFVVKAIQIAKEFYVGVTIDSAKGDIVLIASAEGGVDIEEVARTNPAAIKKFYAQGRGEVPADQLRAFVAEVFDDEEHQRAGAEAFERLIRVFVARDCSLAEINPFVVDADGRVWAADAKMDFDDNALFRHPELEALRDMRYEDPDELEAKAAGLSFVKLEGDIGCIVNGAGLAMGTVDAIKLFGGEPANFLDAGGSSNPQKVLTALRLILKNPNLKAILINIFGGITRCDDIAQGIVQAKEQLAFSVPLVVRLTGTNEQEARDILQTKGIKTYGSMRQAVETVVAVAKGEADGASS